MRSRLLAFVVAIGVIGIACGIVFAQGKSEKNSPAHSSSAAPQVTASSGSVASETVESDEDESADLPRIARGHISMKDYFAARDRQVSVQRGVDDLVQQPTARAQAIRKMAVQEQAVQQRALETQQKLRTGQAVRSAATLAAGTVPTWTPIGPAPIPNGQTNGVQVPVSGRVTAMAVDPTNPDILYVGAAQGGVYRSIDGGTTWTALTDAQPSLAIGAITIAPSDHNIVFVGSGEASFAIDSFFGAGVYLIQGATTATPIVTPLPVTPDVFTGRAISRIVVNPTDPNKILVGTASGFSGLSSDVFNNLPSRGLYLSTNALSVAPTFTRLDVPAGLANRGVTDMAIDPNATTPQTVVLNILSNPGDAATAGGVFVSNGDPWSGNATWTQVLSKPQTIARFAVARSGTPTPTTTFIGTFDEQTSCTANGVTTTVNGSAFKTTDPRTAGAWTQMAGASGFCGTQCFYDMAPAFDPTNANTIYLGGAAGNSIGACRAGIFGKSTDGGATFTPSTTRLHADSHVTAVAPSLPSRVYAGNDGGIFRSDDGGLTWASLNNAGFNATQFQSMTVHPTDPNYTIGGTQDNGTNQFSAARAWSLIDFGDGGYSVIDSNSTSANAATLYHTYFNATNSLMGYATDTTTATPLDPNTSFASFFGCVNGVSANGIGCSDSVNFYAPLVLGPGNPNTVYFGTDRLYRSANKGVSNTVVSQIFQVNTTGGVVNVPISAINVSRQNDNVRIVGLSDGQVFATASGNATLTEVTSPLFSGANARYIARAVIDPRSATTAYVTLDGYGIPNHIFKTTNLTTANLSAGTVTWTPVSNGIPDVPVNAFAVDPSNSLVLYAGTDIGVFNSIDGGATWAPYGSGLPRVAVFDLAIQPPTHTVRIGTHGRGAWEIAGVNLPAAADFDVLPATSSASVAAGTSATFNFTVSPANGFTGNVNLSCSDPATLSTCSFNPATVNVTGTGASAVLTVTTTARTAAVASAHTGAPHIGFTGFASFGLLGVILVGTTTSRKRRWLMVGMALTVVALGTMVACGGGGGGGNPPPPPPPPVVTGTPAGTYTINVSATSGAITHTTSVSVIVQ
jgi:hypothetical protein